MKRLLLLLLCLPFLYAAASQGYQLAEWEWGGRIGSGSPKGERVAKPSDAAKTVADELAKLQEGAIIVGGTARNAAEPPNGQFNAFGRALDNHRKTVNEARSNFVVIMTTDDPAQLKGEFPKLRNLVDKPERNFASLKEEFKKCETRPAAVATLLRRIGECQEEWRNVKKISLTAQMAQRKLDFLDVAVTVVKLMGEKDNWDEHFRSLEKIANAGSAGDLTALLRNLAVQKAKEVYLSAEDLQLDEHIELRVKGNEWTAYDLSKTLDDSKPLIYVTIDGTQLEARSVAQFGKDDKLYLRMPDGFIHDKFVEPNEGPKGYKNRVRPTRKSVVAHAYNRTIKIIREAKSLTNLEQSLWEEYRKCAVKNKLLAEDLDKKSSSFAVDELKTHYPVEARFERLLLIVRDCPKLFSREP